MDCGVATNHKSYWAFARMNEVRPGMSNSPDYIISAHAHMWINEHGIIGIMYVSSSH